jgi:hypothetical protein
MKRVFLIQNRYEIRKKSYSMNHMINFIFKKILLLELINYLKEVIVTVTFIS